MPKFRVSGSVTLDFLHEIEAGSEEEAIRLMGNLHYSKIDDVVANGNTIDYAIELDEEGNEIDA